MLKLQLLKPDLTNMCRSIASYEWCKYFFLASVVAFFSLALVQSAAAVPTHVDPAREAKAKPVASAWGWSFSSRRWAEKSGVLPSTVAKQRPTTHLTRGEFLSALVKLQQLQSKRSQHLMKSRKKAPALIDARANSVAARAVANQWFVAINGRFDAGAPITADEAARATLAALGLGPDVSLFARRLRDELAGVTGVRWTYASAHALARTLGLRYNVLDPYDRYELGPQEAVNLAHGSYMLRAAARVESWRMEAVHDLAKSFDLPELNANQLLVLGSGARLLGQPYVWAGETEGRQAEGHGGFDCSGFTIRIINGSGVPENEIARVAERTTYTQSALPVSRRINIAQLAPADLIFFGDAGPKSTPSQNFHVGVYMGNGWFIHSSGGNGGVAIDKLDGWWQDYASWGRRALIEL